VGENNHNETYCAEHHQVPPDQGERGSVAGLHAIFVAQLLEKAKVSQKGRN